MLWICWLQGIDNAPPIVRGCVDRWKKANPEWDVRIISMADVESYSDILSRFDLSRRRITPASFSDILRVDLLYRHGGIWADATSYCNTPLDDWIVPVMSAGFFAFKSPAPNRPLSSWFIASEQENLLITDLARRVESYWEKRISADEYFWFHGLFRNMLRKNPRAAELWQNVPELSAKEAHSFERLMNLPTRRAPPNLDLSSPVLKLSHKIPSLRPDALVGHLLGIGDPRPVESSISAGIHPSLNLLANPSELPFGARRPRGNRTNGPSMSASTAPEPP
ncbi:capsular polysaccharide synthesis protein [Falsirhodobacter halotolerans]|uniref:capsular polysaccharide synthesis protein n=1 Tax=Falsirhodobacter halotolerans TaxID=1146892 RepID=UPI003CC7C506